MVKWVAGLAACALAYRALGVDTSPLTLPKLVGEVNPIVEQLQLLALST